MRYFLVCVTFPLCRYVASVNQALQNREIEFLQENFDHVSVVDQHCVYFDGKREELEYILERFLLISSTCYVKKDLHSREKDHKRFSKSGKPIVIF